VAADLVSYGERGGGVEREREREREREGWGSLVIYLAHLKRERESTHTYTHITHQSANLTQTCILPGAHGQARLASICDPSQVVSSSLPEVEISLA
jgi:hypothetical protein